MLFEYCLHATYTNCEPLGQIGSRPALVLGQRRGVAAKSVGWLDDHFRNIVASMQLIVEHGGQPGTVKRAALARSRW
jgi:hypothetical protein